MKPLNIIVILMLIFVIFCKEGAQQEKSKNNAVNVPDSAILNEDLKFLPGSPFRIDSIVVSPGDSLIFVNKTDYDATFIIPNFDKLFERNKSDDSLMFITMSNVKYLRQDLSAQSESRIFIINENANPDSLDKIYPFAVFCRNAAYAAERNSSPIIIVKPDN